jgi:hypothetical protein
VASVTCPECQHRFRLPTNTRSGDGLTCPECDAAFEVGQIPTAPPKRLRKPEPKPEPEYDLQDEEEEEEERPRRRADRRRRRSASRTSDSRIGMQRVSLGFKLVFYSVVLMAVAVLLAILGGVLGGGALMAGGRGGLAGLGLAGLLLGGAYLLSTVGYLLGLIGVFLCLAVPNETGNAKTLIMICIGLLLGAIAVTLASVAGVQVGPGGPVAFGLGFLLPIMSGIVFLLFCRALALYLDRPDLADLAMTILWLMVIIFVMWLGMTVAMLGGAVVGGGGAGVAMVLGCAVWLISFVLGIMALIKFAQLTRDMSDACARFADRGYGGDDPGW